MKIDFATIFFWAIFGSVIFVFLLAFIFGKRRKLQIGTVIILNGPSASGKSSIQREFQKLLLPELWIKVGVDNLFDAVLPDITPENMAYWQKENDIRYVTNGLDAQGHNVITLHVGQVGDEVAYGMNAAIAAYARAGCNVIVDYIAYKKEWVDDLNKQLVGYNVWYRLSTIGGSRRTFFNNEKSLWSIDFINSYSSYRMPKVKAYFVKVAIPLDLVEAREASRGTSPAGHARSHYHTIHEGITYDLVVESDKKNAQEIAKEIKAYLLASGSLQ